VKSVRFVVIALTFVPAALAARAATPAQADAFERKMSLVLQRSADVPSGARTEFEGDEVNAYLQLRLISRFPTGVTEPAVSLVGDGRLNGRAIVDLDGIRRKSSGGWLDPASYLAGRLPVTATGTLKTSAGRGELALERVEISGIPVPTALLQEIVAYYTRSPEYPNGVSLNDPFTLPARIQHIEIEKDRATVVQ
jgi:hypothetical protein